jgi:hypothetical protein
MKRVYRVYRAIINWSLVIAATLLCTACGDSEDAVDPADRGRPPSQFRDYGIRLFARGSDDSLMDLALPPVRAVSAPGLTPDDGKLEQTSSALSTGAKPLAHVESPEAGTLDLDGEFPSAEPGWALLVRAVAQCASEEGVELGGVGSPWYASGATRNWYVFSNQLLSSGKPAWQSCEASLLFQEMLLCAAEKLEQIASAVSPLRWPAVSQQGFGDIYDPEWMHAEWVIPPQRERDRFIVRDLAINALAHVARLELEVPNVSAGALPYFVNKTCTDVYVFAGATGTGYSDYSGALYGAYWSSGPRYLDLDPNNSSYREEHAEARLRFKAHILRAAGRLLKRLIDDSVMGDLAGAERQRALAGDSRRGPALLWGADSDADAPYNSLAHAFRVVFGRWETGRPTGWGALPQPTGDAPLPSPDPKCGGLSPIELLVKADGSSPLGEGQSARWSDKPIMTEAQRLAVGIVDRAGIVIPKAKAETADFDTLLFATAVQSLVNGLAANDPQVNIDDPNLLDNPLVRSRYDILVRFVQGISEQDLRFALSRSSNNYRLLAGVGTSAAVTPVSGSTRTAQGVQLAPQNLVLSELKTVLDGNVIAGGMPREDLAIDIMARVGPGQAASMCPEVEPGIMPRGHANVGKVSAFQDSFLIGDLLRRRLSALRKLTENGWPQSSGIGETAFPKLAERGAAELRAWTGPGHLVLFKQSGSFDVLIHGASEQDFGLPAEYDVPGLALVWGKPWVADCAARQRSSCPENFARDYMQLPTLGSMIVKENNAYLGSDERTYAFSFPDAGATECGSSSPCKFNPAYQLQGTEGDEYLYLILLNDPANAGKGRVLTTFPYYGDIGGASLYSLISTHQRKLANDLSAS